MPSSKDPFPDLNPSEPQPILIRASNGKSKKDRSDKVKISTVVKPDELEGFYTRYADVCKAGMTALKPRDRSKKKAKAKKKKPATT
jgi:signal recognition particle subunit SRP14